MGGGRGILTCISTAAITGIGTALTNAKRIVPKSSFFIFIKSLLVCESTRFVLPDPVAHLVAHAGLVKGNDISCPFRGFTLMLQKKPPNGHG